MANPRARKKARSSIPKNSQSKRSKKNAKKVVVTANPIVAASWDRKKTVRQNYTALGLLTTPNPRLQGGLEPLPITPFALLSEEERNQNQKLANGPTPKLGPNGEIPKGFALIKRNDKGDIVDVVLADDDQSEEQSRPTTAWGEPLNEDDPNNDGIEEEEWQGIERKEQGIPMPAVDGVKIVNRTRKPTEIVKKMEAIASQRNIPLHRHSSALEINWLKQCIAKHGDDIEAICRDKKLNIWQRTSGEVRRALQKAGGVDAFR